MSTSRTAKCACHATSQSKKGRASCNLRIACGFHSQTTTRVICHTEHIAKYLSNSHLEKGASGRRCDLLVTVAAQALYRGNGANVVRLVPDIAFKFVVHDQFKVMFTPADGSPLGVLERFAAGAATGVCIPK